MKNGNRMVSAKGGRWLLVLVVTAATVSLGLVGLSDSELLLKIHRGIDLFGKVYKEITVNYVDDVDPERFMRAGIDGMLKTLDPYTVFLGEKESDELDLVTSGKYGGVGITIGVRDGRITIVNMLEGFSAAKQGLSIGDRILEVDGVPVSAESMDQVRMLVRGTPGTMLRMKIERDGEPGPLEFTLVREEIPVRNVAYTGYLPDGIGYIKLERFSRTAGEDIRMAIRELRAKGTLKGLVLDLRDNPGGLLDVAVDVASKFVPESSLIVSTRGRKRESERKYFSAEKPIAGDIPLAVLVNRSSASASEIVAGAIQDLDRGVVVGTRTFGKGLVQTISRLSESASLKITTARYYTPSGRSIQEIDYSSRDPGVPSRFSGSRTAGNSGTKQGTGVVPDSLRKEFSTAHNRKVYDNGGILPDSTVAEPERSRYHEALLRRAMFFKFANHYAAQNKTLPEGFEVNDALLAEFERFLAEKGFEFRDQPQLRLEEVKLAAQEANYGKEFFRELERLEALMEAEKKQAFARHKQEIQIALKAEIIGRMKGDHARIEAMTSDDPQLMTAASLLKNQKAYSKILSGRAKD
jgi:carboxyl-terminal processing protease